MQPGITHKGTHQNLLGKDGMWRQHYLDEFSLEKQVGRQTPPTFIALSSNDTTVPAENSLRYYNELIDKKIPVEMHMWPIGGHGWGFSKEKYVGKGNDKFNYARNEFETSLERWLKEVR
jgi:dipeptidyl aminopeptidase/acylaminoacyl peptidase